MRLLDARMALDHLEVGLTIQLVSFEIDDFGLIGSPRWGRWFGSVVG
jgi:hypothetical protein